jgi:hypothetical protein
MQFTVTNNCDFPIDVYASNVDYSPGQLAKMIDAKDVLKKAIYDYYWGNKLNLDWSSKIQKNTISYLKYYGIAKPTDSVEVYNLSRVSEYLYTFFTQVIDKKIVLSYFQIPIREYFNKYDTMAVYQYTVRVNQDSGTTLATSDASTGALLVDYFGVAYNVEQQKVDWMPSMQEQTNHTTWQLPIIIFILIIMMVVAIIIVFVITIKQPTIQKVYKDLTIQQTVMEPIVKLS